MDGFELYYISLSDLKLTQPLESSSALFVDSKRLCSDCKLMDNNVFYSHENLE